MKQSFNWLFTHWSTIVSTKNSLIIATRAWILCSNTIYQITEYYRTGYETILNLFCPSEKWSLKNQKFALIPLKCFEIGNNQTELDKSQLNLNQGSLNLLIRKFAGIAMIPYLYFSKRQVIWSQPCLICQLCRVKFSKGTAHSFNFSV